MKPGYTTTEFWITLLSYVVSIIALFHPGMPTNTAAYVQAAALLVSGALSIIYTHSRQQVKVATLQSPPAPQTTLVMRPTTTVDPSATTTLPSEPTVFTQASAPVTANASTSAS
jgi:Short repeat of unknown function (DUF308)